MATVKDIAKRVGVSATTVSIVLNGKAEERNITKATQEKIYQAIKELGYQPNLSARRLRSGEDSPAVIGFFWPSDHRTTILAAYLNIFSERIRELDFSCQVTVQIYDNDNLKALDKVLLTGGFSAVVVGCCSTEDLRHLESLQLSGPTIVIDRESTLLTTVGADNEEVGRMAAEKLFEKGYFCAALFASNKSFPANTKRGESFLHHCRKLGISVEPYHIYRDVGTTSGGYRMAQRFGAAQNCPPVIFCDSDAIALGALRALHELRIRVPEDVEVLSTDVTASDLSVYSIPSMSILQIPTDKIAVAVIDIVKEQLGQTYPEPLHIKFPPNLVLRESFSAEK